MSGFETIEVRGEPVRMYVAGEARDESPGIVLFHAWWGLNDDAIAFADRLAAAGYAVIAPDMFDGQIASTREEASQLARAAEEEAINDIALAAVDHLAGRIGQTAKLAAIGFSFGAHWAIWSPGQRDRVVVSVLYYGTTDGSVLTSSAVPVLGHFAEGDEFESDEWVAEFAQKLRSAGREVVVHLYPGTGHWFAEPSKDAYVAEAADLAFDRTVAFLDNRIR